MLKLSNQSALSPYFPEFQIINPATFRFNPAEEAYVLRSSLKAEGGDALLSGRSLTFKNIRTSDDYEKAISAILDQSDLETVVIQKQIEFEKHYTAVTWDGLTYIESTFSKGEFCYSTKWTKVGFLEHQNLLLTTIAKFQNQVPNRCLFEIGVLKNQLYIFQIIEISKRYLQHFYGGHTLWRIAQWQSQRGRLFHMLSNEFKAFRLRRRAQNSNEELTTADSFQNWCSIVHYFHLFCRLYKKTPDFTAWVDYFSWLHIKKHFVAKQALQHLILANNLSQKLSTEVPLKMSQLPSEIIFIGNGKVTAPISECQIINQLTPEAIYESSQEQIILTTDNRLLSHGFLAAVEKQRRLVANIPEPVWSDFGRAKILKIDFDARSLEVL